MTAGTALAPWQATSALPSLDRISDPNRIVANALQLRDRERQQIATNFEAGNFELVATFVWTRAMALLKKQLAQLGNSFIGELLQRPDIDEMSDVGTAVSDSEAISLATDLGMITATQSMRLLQSQATVTHFSTLTRDDVLIDDSEMTQEEAISCLRICVQGVLGQEQFGPAEDFRTFRQRLASETFLPSAPEIARLETSPYFFIRTAISVLMSLFKTSKGAQLEHASRNALLLIPRFWPRLKEPERWQIGLSYASEFNEGRRESVRGMHAVLLAVQGFDYVPENLRSTTFIKVASAILSAHQGMNNFYNEPAPTAELARLGTSIPSPALPACLTAVLCVKLGNPYGVSYEAQAPADQILSGISQERWTYYLDGRLQEDRIVLSKLTSSGPVERWIQLVRQFGLADLRVETRSVRGLLTAAQAGDRKKVSDAAQRMFVR